MFKNPICLIILADEYRYRIEDCEIYENGFHSIRNASQKEAKSGRGFSFHSPSGYRFTTANKKKNTYLPVPGQIIMLRCTHNAKCKAKIRVEGSINLDPIFTLIGTHEVDGVPHRPSPRLYGKCPICVSNSRLDQFIDQFRRRLNLE